MKTKRIKITLPSQMVDAVKHRAERERRTLSQQVGLMLDVASFFDTSESVDVALKGRNVAPDRGS